MTGHTRAQSLVDDIFRPNIMFVERRRYLACIRSVSTLETLFLVGQDCFDL